MPDRSLDAVLYVQKVPTVSYEDGLFHVGYDVGKVRAEFVMQPKVFFAALHEAVEVSRKHGGRRNVVPLHAASASGKSSK